MTPSELLELTSQLEFSKRCRWQANRSYCTPVIREEDVDHIIKSLRFAADMDRLSREDIIINQMAGEVWIEGFGFSVVGSDIYSAARKAVEALEGGK